MVEEPVREHSVGVARLTAGLGAGAVQRRLHRRRRDAVRVDDERLDEQHDRDGADDRDDPVDRHPPRVGQAAGQPVDRVARVPHRPRRRGAGHRARAACTGMDTAARSAASASRDRRRRRHRRRPAAVPSSRSGGGGAGESSAPAPARRRRERACLRVPRRARGAAGCSGGDVSSFVTVDGDSARSSGRSSTSLTRCSASGSARPANRRSGRGSRRAARRAPPSLRTLRGACSADTRGRPRAQR